MHRENFVAALFCLILACLSGAGCVKEYSAEGRTSPVVTDTIDANQPTADTGFTVPACAGCAAEPSDNQWSLTVNGALLCGIIDTAIVSPDRKALTFFGPSACSPDSGLIISAWLQPETLDQSQSRFNAAFASFYYYDNVGGGYLLLSERAQPILLTVLKYDHSTKEAEGTFNGTAYTHNGRPVPIAGKWKTKFH